MSGDDSSPPLYSSNTTYDEHLHRVLSSAWIQHKNRGRDGIPADKTLKSLATLIGFGKLDTIRTWFKERFEMEQRIKVKEGKAADNHSKQNEELQQADSQQTDSQQTDSQQVDSQQVDPASEDCLDPKKPQPKASKSSLNQNRSTHASPSRTLSQLPSSHSNQNPQHILALIAAAYPPLECPGCFQIFPNRNQVKDHVRDRHHGERVYRCVSSGCSRALESLCGLGNHLRTSHSTHGLETITPHKTPPPLEQAPRLAPRKRRLSLSPLPTRPCPSADDLLLATNHTTSQLRLHTPVDSSSSAYPSPHRAFVMAFKHHTCPVCRCQFTSNRGIDKHLREQHPLVKPFGCSKEECKGKRFASLGSRAHHYRKRHESGAVSEEAEENDSDGGMVVDGMMGKDSPSLRRSSDHDEKLHDSCDDSPNSEHNTGNETNPAVAYHLASRQLRCPLCDCPALTSKARVDSHIRVKHPGARPFGCAQAGCQSSFSSLLVRRNHWIMKHREVSRSDEVMERESEGCNGGDDDEYGGGGEEEEGEEEEEEEREEEEEKEEEQEEEEGEEEEEEDKKHWDHGELIYNADNSDDNAMNGHVRSPQGARGARISETETGSPFPRLSHSSSSISTSATPSSRRSHQRSPRHNASYACPVSGCDARFRGNRALGAHLHVVHQEGISELDPEESSGDDEGRGDGSESSEEEERGRGRKKGERSLVVTVRIDGHRGRGSVGRHGSRSPQLREVCVRHHIVSSNGMLRSSRTPERHLNSGRVSPLPPFSTPTPLPPQHIITCVRCRASFPLEEDMHQHLLSDHRIIHAAALHPNAEGKFPCPVTGCIWKLGRSSDIIRHLKRAHQLEILNEGEMATKVSGPSDGSVATNEEKSFSQPGVIAAPPTSSLLLQDSHRPYCDTAATIDRIATPIDNGDDNDDILTHTALALTTLANDSTPQLVRNAVQAGASLFTPLMTPSRVIQPSYELGPAPVFDIFGLATMGSLGGNDLDERNGNGRGERMMGDNENGGGVMSGNREDRGNGRNLLDGKSNLWSNLGASRDDRIQINQDESRTKPVPIRLDEFHVNFREEVTRQRDEDISMKDVAHDDSTIATAWDMHILQRNGMRDEFNIFARPMEGDGYAQTIAHDQFFPHNYHPNPTTWDEIHDPLYHNRAMVPQFDSRERVQTPSLVGSELSSPSPYAYPYQGYDHYSTTATSSLSPSPLAPQIASDEGEVSLFLSFLRNLHRVE